MLTIITDVDDTVCPSTQPMAPAMASEISRLIKGGCHFAFISGSSLKQISDQISPFLGVPHHLLPASGAQYFKVEFDGSEPRFVEQYKLEFKPDERKEILSALESLIRRFDIRPLTTREDQLQDRGSQITLSAVGRHAPDEIKRALDPDGSKRGEWVAYLKTLLGERYSLRIGGTTSIDITPQGIDKAYGIRKFLELNRIKPSECLFFGDKLGPGGNDAPANQVVDCVEVRDPEHTLEILSRFKPGPKN